MQIESAHSAVDAARRVRVWGLVALAVAAIIGVMMHEPIAQPAGYHAFADQRALLGIPSFWNVMSNLAFLAFGLMGTVELARLRAYPQRTMYFTFFAGACLVAIGSGYYHLDPDNRSLVWDRLPMAIVFMAFFSIIIAEHISARAAARLFFPLLVFAVASVLYWHVTEEAGRGDLRLYIIAQFLPIILTPLILWWFPSQSPQMLLIWAVLATYAGAKILELADGEVYALLRVVSGHTLKHLAAAFGVYLFLLAMKRRCSCG